MIWPDIRNHMNDWQDIRIQELYECLARYQELHECLASCQEFYECYLQDAGEYSCEAENKMGVIRSRKATLTAPCEYFTL